MSSPDSSQPVDPIDAITVALARLRSPRGPRPPWDDGTGRRGGPGGHGPFGHHGGPHHLDGSGHGHHGAAWQGAMQARFAGAARFRLLEALAAASAPLSVSELADAVGVDQPRASRLVQQAVGSGHVRREADPDDARRTRIALTDAGRALVKGFRGQRREAVESALADFTADDRAELARLLSRLADAWPVEPPR